MKTYLATGAGAILGGIMGQTQLLCAADTCYMLGTLYGGTLLGSLVGYILGSATALPKPEAKAVAVRVDDTQRQYRR